ncbi:hypothetical protein M422DRAFT_247327 [Sphaerobolus stellatus SS14]|nr:hypothetical protein M422DRAFT_247327 [Sphaerobolus stellatus SS14]
MTRVFPSSILHAAEKGNAPTKHQYDLLVDAHQSKRKGENLSDPRNVKNVRLVNGQEIIWQEPSSQAAGSQTSASPGTSQQVGSTAKTSIANGITEPSWIYGDEGGGVMDFGQDGLGWEQNTEDEDETREEEPIPDTHPPNNDRNSNDAENGLRLRQIALAAMYKHEAPPPDGTYCGTSGCHKLGLYQCEDCDLPCWLCKLCVVSSHVSLPLHRTVEWQNTHYVRRPLADLGLTLNMGHGLQKCQHTHDGTGVQKIIIVDLNGVHEIMVAWCRCAHAPSLAEQLFGHKLFPASLSKPRTAFTFRLFKFFQLLNHVARTSPWDFAGTLHRLTDNVNPQGSPNIYKNFKDTQRQWRVVRAWKRAGVLDATLARDKGSLVIPCVSCPMPGINLDNNWQDHPDSELIHTMFIGGDGNFRLRRHHKGGGEFSDPSLFGDEAFYAPQNDFREFYKIRGLKPDETVDVRCANFRAGNPEEAGTKHATNGQMTISCIRSGAFAPKGTVDIPHGERFVNFDFAVTQVLADILERGISRIVISYDIACKYHIHFHDRIHNCDWPLMTRQQRRQLREMDLVWLVPKWHLSAHIDGCQDKFSFNWTSNVGRTCGEIVETNWASLNLLATATREMGFGHRRDTLNDSMIDTNWRKLVNEGPRLLKSYKKTVELFLQKQKVVRDLEGALGEDIVMELHTTSLMEDGRQYRPKPIEAPSRVKLVKRLQEEEKERTRRSGLHSSEQSTRITACVGINMGLDLEMRQQNLRLKIKEKNNPTMTQELDKDESRRKLSKTLEAWYKILRDFIPPEALEHLARKEVLPENQLLLLPSDYDQKIHEAVGLVDLAEIEYRLRVGQAHDCLKKLRDALGLKSFFVRRQRIHATGQQALTRSKTEILRAQRQVDKWAEV